MKELYIAEYERIRSKLEDAGCPADLAEEIAAEQAYPAMRERLADHADMLRKRERETSDRDGTAGSGSGIG